MVFGIGRRSPEQEGKPPQPESNPMRSLFELENSILPNNVEVDWEKLNRMKALYEQLSTDDYSGVTGPIGKLTPDEWQRAKPEYLRLLKGSIDAFEEEARAISGKSQKSPEN